MSLVLTILLTIPTFAADDAARLRSLGATVTEANGAVTKVTFKDCSKLAEPDFQRIGQIKSLKSLTLYGRCAGLTDQTLPSLTSLSALEELSTEGVQLSDDGLKPLAQLSNLKSLAFFHLSLQLKGFTGRGFVHLKPLAKLERLTVAGTSFNDEGMASVGQLTQLREFRTWHTYQTPAGNVELTKLVNLTSLRFGQRLRRYNGQPNALTLDDEALATLAKIPALETLYLDEARLSFDGLSKLAAMPKLKSLTLEKVEVPAEDVEKLRKALPAVKLVVKPVEAADAEKLKGALKP